jgi:glycine cleavage system transcriptional repressor
MRLAITVLGKKSTAFMTNILATIATCKCNILDLNVSRFSESTVAAHLLVQGNWNYLAKLESHLEQLEKRLDIKIHSLHTEPPQTTDSEDSIPYTLETISINSEELIQDMMTFLLTHHITIAEMKCSCYPAVYSQTPLLATKFIILIPADIPLMCFREEMLNFCDNCNVDAIFEPIKR